MMDILIKIKDQVGLSEQPPQEASVWDDLGDDFALSKKQRLAGFAMSIGMGVVCLFLAVTFAPAVILVPKKFAFFFTFGNIFLMASTMFLVGPSRQFKSMMEASRWQATVVYFASMSGTLASALWLGSTMLVLIFTCVQLAAMVWYCMSYIPFARTIVKRFLRMLRII